MKIQILYEASDEGGWTVTVPALPGCISEGDTRQSATSNIKEAISLYLEEVDDDVVFDNSTDVEYLSVAI
ncbi:MAG: type II toxin-antitoxin system HicB family antitoxin [Gammaproteobacteria bacterium]|nr:MAG: type II toxin-antitoxin system HicB family antitoxin [Gammaproteobacteria bacterium]